MVCLSVCLCVTFVVFNTDCESCTRPISTNPGSMEAGEYELTRKTCFAACRLEVIAVAGLQWISWCVEGAAGFRFFFFERKQPASSMRPPLPHLPSSRNIYVPTCQPFSFISMRGYVEIAKTSCPVKKKTGVSVPFALFTLPRGANRPCLIPGTSYQARVS